jgi:hypothetical protein
MWWERDEREPFPSAFPAIIEFLGEEPWPEPRTLAEALVAERRRRGLAVEHAADLVGVDPGTWLRWEQGVWRPTALTVPGIDQFLGMSCRERFPEGVR